MLKTIRTYAVGFFALALLVTNSGCDFLAEKLGVDYVDVPSSSFGEAVDVTPGVTTYSSGSASLGNVKLPNVFNVDEIQIQASNLTFTASEALGKVSGSGVIRAVVVLQGVCAANFDITVTNDAVTAISKSTLSLGSCDSDGLAALKTLGAAAQSTLLATNAFTITPAQAQALINTAIKALKINGSVVLRVVSGNVKGKLKVDAAKIHLDF